MLVFIICQRIGGGLAWIKSFTKDVEVTFSCCSAGFPLGWENIAVFVQKFCGDKQNEKQDMGRILLYKQTTEKLGVVFI